MEPAADESLSRMLSKIAHSHDEFMAKAMEGITQSLMRHNVLLATELRSLKARDGVERVVVEPPRVPAFPDAWVVGALGGENGAMLESDELADCLGVPLSPIHRPSTPSRAAWGATSGAHGGRGSRALSPMARRKARGTSTRPRITVMAHSDGESDSSEPMDRSGPLALIALDAPPQPPGVVLPGAIPGEPAPLPRTPSKLSPISSLGASSWRGAAPKRSETQAVESLEEKRRSKEGRRLRALLGLSRDDDVVMPDHLQLAVGRRCSVPSGLVDEAVEELQGLQCKLSKARPQKSFFKSRDSTQGIPFESLLDLLFLRNLNDHVAAEKRFAVGRLVQALKTPTVDEIIDDVTKDAKEGDSSLRTKGWKLRLNAVVVTMVIVNLFAMGFSVDFQPGHKGWFALEVLCTAVFVFEAAIKMYMEGIRELFSGPARHWNIVDVIVTLFALLDMAYSIHLMEESSAGREASVSSAARIAIGARVLRIVRLVRLTKLMHSPVLRDLANMLTGFVIGVPSLIWVLALFCGILYMLGLFFRLILGPAVGQDMLSLCGRPDDYVQADNEDCRLHYMYGEEFFGTVLKSMFTVFRFMLSDYSTMGGKSMIVAFSQGYGMKFDIVFVAWMIFVIFGMFNIITAVFVDTTVCGLKHNDVKRKFARQYERRYVKAKLKSLIERVRVLHADMTMPSVTSLRHAISEGKRDSEDFELEEDEFVQVMEDSQVKALLEDLDVMMFNPVGLFDTFDPDGDGRVTMQAMVLAILKLRGEPQKNDIIASVVALRSLHEKVDHMELALAQLAQVAQQDRPVRASLDVPKPWELKR